MSAQRLPSLDVFRGLTIAGMVLVNNPGTWAHIYPPLRHAEWHGCTPTDLIFPFFLFIVGGGMAFWFRGAGDSIDPSIRRAIAGRTLRRGLFLVAIGLAMAAVSSAFKVAQGQLTLAQAWETLRFPGVLQRIGLCSLVAGAVVMGTQPRHQLVLGGVLLAGYAAVLAYVPGVATADRLSEQGSLVGWIDRVVLGPSHLLDKDTAHGFDPEGLLSTLPAIVTTLMGYWSVRILRALRVGSERTVEAAGVLVALGAIVAAGGWLWGLAHPINKQLWTSSYVLLTSGLAMIALGACHALVDIWNFRRLFAAAEIMGRNALFVFVGSGMVARVMLAAKVGSGTDRAPLHRWLYTKVFETPTSPELGSMLMAAATVAAWWVVAWVMHQRKWYVRL